MFKIEATVLLLVLVLSSVTPKRLPLVPDSPLDQYGTIPWEDEKARLDQLFIQLQHWENLIGYILVVEAVNGCPGEAQARSGLAGEWPLFVVAWASRSSVALDGLIFCCRH